LKRLLTYITTVSIAILASSCSFDTRNTNNNVLTSSFPIVKSGKKIVVAVIDTGADIRHDDIKDNLWTDKSGKSNGWNFVDNNSNVTDNMGHGTHIAGIIKASSANVSLMILKYYDPKASAKNNAFENSLKALRFAVNNGADIINYSGGGEGSSIEEFELLREAESKGIIVVSAAGNGSSDLDAKPYYPASYKLSNIITVASTDEDGDLTEESNYGASSVDVAAPGEDVFSSLPGNKHGYLTGTSQATAVVTAIVASVKAQNPKASFKEIKRIVLASAVKDIKTAGKVSTGVISARVNTGKLLAFQKPVQR
jgi:major intracellular serine protease